MRCTRFLTALAIRLLFVAICSASLLVAQDRSWPNSCSVTLKVVDAQGFSRDYKVTSARIEGRGADFSHRFTGTVAKDIRCEIYKLRLSPQNTAVTGIGRCKDDEIRERAWILSTRHTLIVIRAPRTCRMIADAGPGFGLTLTFANLPHSMSQLWCALLPATLGLTADNFSEIDRSGNAFFYGRIEEGLYILVVQEFGKVHATIPIELPVWNKQDRMPIIDVRKWMTPVVRADFTK